ncbi:NADPH--cytochrome P450 reductase-like isoform X2 [Patiria miniata]|uniref:NADPH--cytochrome P450 reductase n=1 Tax=Patiria miniata TaxID=46514 RepID=A0A913ZV58_PATMI|nr:NADPH--cytochrome P450 reductase-like isoform X2 [Patiria miniata]
MFWRKRRMATPEMAEAASKVVAEPMFGVLDILLMSVSLGIGVYWFFFRGKKTSEQPSVVKKLSVAPTLTRSSNVGFIAKMKSSGKNLVVFYGSQTGTGEEFATRLSKDALRFGMKGMIADPEECEMEDLAQLTEVENSMAIFCMATYGEGDPTDNAQEFYDWLQEGSVGLAGLRYAVFGLGNKTYEHYNAMGIYVDKRLEDLGAERIYDLGLGDDDGNMEEDFVTWREQFWPAVCQRFGVQATGDESSIRTYALRIEDFLPEKVFTGEVARLGSFRTQKRPFDSKNPYLAPVKVNRELHKGGERSCMHIEFDITDSKIRYEAGDHVAVFPINDSALVDRIAELLGADLDVVMSLDNLDEEASKKHPFPCPCSYRTAFTHYLDITSVPRTNVLKDIAEYASDPKDKEFLLLLSSATPEGKKEYSEWVMHDHRSIVAILEDLPSLKPPLDHLCELLPRLHARYYSISSSPKLHPTSIHITAVLTRYTTRVGRQVNGVATSWLKGKVPNGPQSMPNVPIYVRKSQFRLPFKPATPVIMVGPGTGLAPFRGFIEERYHAKKEGKVLGETVLFFGCRNRDHDYIYEDELKEYQENQTLSAVYVAFSREQAEKQYVQHIMMQKKEKIWELLEQGGHIYVCGDARYMAPDVQKVIRTIISEHGDKTHQEADDYIKKLQSKGRYACDVWS